MEHTVSGARAMAITRPLVLMVAFNDDHPFAPMDPL